MTDPNLLGFGHAEDYCAPECFTQTEAYNFGIGVVRSGSWIKQNPVLTGYAAVEAYLPSKKIAIAVVNTFGQAYFQDAATRTSRRTPRTWSSRRSPRSSPRTMRRRRASSRESQSGPSNRATSRASSSTGRRASSSTVAPRRMSGSMSAT